MQTQSTWTPAFTGLLAILINAEYLVATKDPRGAPGRPRAMGTPPPKQPTVLARRFPVGIFRYCRYFRNALRRTPQSAVYGGGVGGGPGIQKPPSGVPKPCPPAPTSQMLPGRHGRDADVGSNEHIHTPMALATRALGRCRLRGSTPRTNFTAHNSTCRLCLHMLIDSRYTMTSVLILYLPATTKGTAHMKDTMLHYCCCIMTFCTCWATYIYMFAHVMTLCVPGYELVHGSSLHSLVELNKNYSLCSRPPGNKRIIKHETRNGGRV